MADQGDVWASPSGSTGDEPPRYGERIPGWQPPPPTATAPPVAPQPGAGYTPPPRPGLIPLHPLAFGQLLGSAFAVLRWNPRATVLPTLVINVVQSALTYGLVYGIGISAVDRISRASAADRGAILAGTAAEGVLTGLLLLAVSVIGNALLQGLIVHVVARGAVGERPTLGESFRRAVGSFWPLLGYALLLGAAQLVAIVALALLVVGVATTGTVGVLLAVLLGLVGGAAYAVAYCFLLVKLATVPSAIVLEGLGIRAAIARSWVLLRGAFWRSLGLILLVFVIVWFAGQVVSLPFSLLGGALGGLVFPNGGTPTSGDDITSMLPTILLTSLPATVVTVIVGAIGQIAQLASLSLIYLDRRIRSEGLDLELQRYVELGGTDPLEPAKR